MASLGNTTSTPDSLILTIRTNLPDPCLSQAKAQTSHNESLRLSRQLESLNRRHEEVERENSEVEAENRNLAKSVENLKIQARRVNELESENLELEGRAHKVERENKSLVREAERLKQSLDVKDLNLDESALKLAGLERSMERG